MAHVRKQSRPERLAILLYVLNSDECLVSDSVELEAALKHEAIFYMYTPQLNEYVRPLSCKPIPGWVVTGLETYIDLPARV